MRVTVKLGSVLSLNRFEKGKVDLPAGTTLRDLLAHLNIAVEEVCVAMVNGQSGAYNQVLADNDQITLLPFIAGG